MKKPATAAEKEHLALIASMPCIVCGLEGVHVHHIGGQYGTRATAWECLPLCPNHHVHGNIGTAVHSGRRSFEANFGTERELLAKVNEILGL